MLTKFFGCNLCQDISYPVYGFVICDFPYPLEGNEELLSRLG